ncbi:MAG: PAS domain-containing protein [Alphaproteobacteria bacterium]|jgi:hypothetical protein
MSQPESDSLMDPSLGFESQTLIDILSFRRRAAGKRAMPTHGDVDPIAIGPALLPHILLIDVVHPAPFRFRWRLIGTHITRAIGRDKTGSYWDEIYDDDALTFMRARADWVVQHKSPLRSTGHASLPDRDVDVNEALHAPISDDGKSVNMILMGSVYSFRTEFSNPW